jgi:hypothetical protein
MSYTQVPHAAARQQARLLDELVSEIAQLPGDWHAGGTVSGKVLGAIARHAGERDVACSVETGCGKTTLLFSHLSANHKVFAVEIGDNRSVSVVRDSPLLNWSTVELIEGPTQLTLPKHTFAQKLQLVLIDGPHGYPFPEMEYYYLYQHLDKNALLIVDDIHIPTIHRLFEFLREDEMFRLLEIVDNAAFFRRTEVPLFDPEGDGWWLQEFNKKRFPVGAKASLMKRVRRYTFRLLPRPMKQVIKRLRRSGDQDSL